MHFVLVIDYTHIKVLYSKTAVSCMQCMRYPIVSPFQNDRFQNVITFHNQLDFNSFGTYNCLSSRS